MADPVTKDNADDQRGATLSNAGPPIPPDETPEQQPDPAAANSNGAANSNAAATPKPNPKDTRIIPPAPSQDQSQFTGNEPAAELSENVKIIKNALGLKFLDPHMEEMLATARVRAGADGQALLIDLPANGHCLHCSKLKDGTEFIGMPTKKMIVDSHDAHVMVGLAKGRGWQAVNVSGTEAEKQLIWLEAMRQGLKVANYNPDPNSEVAQTWAKEFAEQPKPTLTEAKPQDWHVNTMKLLQYAASQATEADVKAGLEGALKKFQDGVAIGTETTFKAAGEALGNKASRENFNKMVDALNNVEPKLALAKLADPTPQPAAKTETPVPPKRDMSPELL